MNVINLYQLKVNLRDSLLEYYEKNNFFIEDCLGVYYNVLVRFSLCEGPLPLFISLLTKCLMPVVISAKVMISICVPPP